MHAIDHIVLPVTTLTLARSRLAALGFTVAPDARHPFGTGNCCVFFESRSYLEPITIQDRDAADRAAAEGLYFIKRIKRFMERQGEGMAMVALSSSDAEVDRAGFEKAGLSAGDTFRFRRKATLPDGSEREIGVTLAYADAPAAPDATIFACQHLDADLLFQPQYLAHPNTATGIEGATAVARDPAMFGDMLVAIGKGGVLNKGDSEISTEIDGQSISVMTPDAFRKRYDTDPPDPRRGLLFAAINLIVSDLSQAEAHGGGAAKRHAERVVVPPAPGLSAVVAFREAEHG